MTRAATPLFTVLLAATAACREPGSGDSGPAGLVDPCEDGGASLYPAMDGPESPVTVRVDDLGVPHIRAASDRDLFFASGYAQAADRLWQLDGVVRTARGELAEVYGEDALASDLVARVIGFSRLGCESIPVMHDERPEDLALFAAWVDGVNRRVAEVLAGEAPLPEEFATWGVEPRPITVADALAVGKRIQFGFANSLANDVLYSLLAGLVPDVDAIPVFQPGADRFIMVDEAEVAPTPRGLAGRSAVVPLRLDGDGARRVLASLAALDRAHGWGPGSNNWVVSGAGTDTGRPILANDPHATIGKPSLLWMQHLDSRDDGGAFDVAGWAFVGLPGVHLGHTDRLAWAATTHMADVMDLWDVPVAEDWSEAEIGGETVPVSAEEEVIRVALGGGSFDEVRLTVHRVEDVGVFLPDEVLPVSSALFADHAVLFGWTGFRATDEAFAYLDFDRARDLDAFEAAAELEEVGMHNWIGATAGGWRYRVHGMLPDRGPVGERGAPYAIMDGTDPDNLWNRGDLDPDLLPRVDGDRDFLVTANNDPWGTTADNDPVDDEVYYASYYAAGFRADRIHRALAGALAEGPVSADAMVALQFDAVSPAALRLVPFLEAAWSKVGEDADPPFDGWAGREDMAAAVAALAAWDGAMRRDSAEAALYRVWAAVAARELLEGDLGVLFDPVEDAAPELLTKVLLLALEEDIDALLDEDTVEGGVDAVLLAALDEALDWTAAEAEARGLEALTWGELHHAAFVEPEGGTVEWPMDGDGTTVNVAHCSMWDGGALVDPCTSSHAAVFRSVVSFDEDGVPVARVATPYGNDGDVERWLEGEAVELPFRDEDIDARTVDTWTLE